MTDIETALKKEISDDALIRYFLTVWPVVESILEAFSKATGLPIFAYLNSAKVFQSSMETMPPFCAAMLGSRSMSGGCVSDGQRRAVGVEPEIAEGVQFCHAGMINGRCEIQTGCIGTIVILYGSRKSLDPEAINRREHIKDMARLQDVELAARLTQADKASAAADGEISPSGTGLMKAIAIIIERLINATVGFRSLSINMAHELTLVMVGLGLLAKELSLYLAAEAPLNPQPGGIELIRGHILSESQLGLYVVRNFLSHASSARYREIVKPRFTDLDLHGLLKEMIDLHRFQAAAKEIEFQEVDLEILPRLWGVKEEIQRLLHNILGNAIKYSYRSSADAKRVIRIRSKAPYDPGFRIRRFAVTIENYGIALDEDEISRVLRPGFRGRHASLEVPIGAGIGLSEAIKIMHLHGGDIKIKSKFLHASETGTPTHHTSLDLIFPYHQHDRRIQNKESK